MYGKNYGNTKFYREKKKSWMKKFRSILKLFNKIEKIEIQKSEKTNEQTTMFFMHNFFLYQAPFVEGKENSDAQKLFFFFQRKKLT